MRKLLIFILCFITVLTLVGCGETTTTNQDNGEVLLNGFEDYSSDFELIRVLNYFGAIDVNTDAKYVKTGNKSARVRPLGGYPSSTQPMMYYPLYSQKCGFDYKNLKKLRQITAEIYNAEQTDVNMTMGLAMEVLNTDMINKTNPEKKVLKPGWNTVAYNVDVSIINILYDIEDAQGVYFGFDRVGSRNIEDAPTLYFDNIKLHYSQKEADVNDLLTFDANEICNFDKLYQKYIVYAEAENPVCEPEIAVVKGSDVGVTATSGDSFLKLTLKKGDTSYGSWPRIVIPEGIMKACPLKNVPESEFDSTYFCFDLYSACGKSVSFYPEFFDGGYSVCYNKWETAANNGKWTTYRIKLSELTKQMVQNPGFFRLSWAEYTDSPADKVIYIDSFRLERL